MGACGSKSTSISSRNTAPWQMDASIDTTSSAPSEMNDESLTLNSVAIAGHIAHEDVCITGWEDGSLKLYNWRSKKAIENWQAHTRAVNRIIASSRTKNLYTCSRDTTICQFTTDAMTTPLHRLKGHTLSVSAISVDEDETKLLSGGRDTQTILWDLTTGKIISRNTIAQNVVTCSRWVPNESVVAQGSEDLSLKFWDTRSPLRTPAQTIMGYVYFPLAMDVSKDGNYLLTSSKGFNGVGCEGRIFDRRTGKQVLELLGHQQDANCSLFIGCFSPSDPIPTPVTASKDGTIKIWDTKTSSVLCETSDPCGDMFTSLCQVPSSSITTILAGTFTGRVQVLSIDVEKREINLK